MKIGLPIDGNGPGGAHSWVKIFTKYCQENGYQVKCSDSDIDIFINLANFSSVEKLFQLKQNGSKVVHRIDGLFFDYTIENKDLANKLNQDITTKLLIADLVIYQSNFSKLLVKKLIPGTELPGIIIYNGADTTLFTPKGPKLGRPQNKKVILSIAYWGTPLFAMNSLTMVRDIAREFVDNSDIEFWVLGKTETKIDDSFLRELPNITRVDLTRPIRREDMHLYLRTADLVLHTRSNDACSNLIIEAMNVGTPVVGLNSGSTPELLADAGLMGECKPSLDSFPILNVPDICDKIKQTFDSYKSYRKKVKKRSKLFTQKIMCKKYLKHLELLLNL